MATYDLTTGIPSSIAAGDILNCPYSGNKVTLPLPAGVYKLEVWGAMGGYRSSTSYAGKGGYSVGTVTLLNPLTTYLYSGGSGQTGKTAGGFNGGGKRSSYNGGGGGSDIRIGEDSLYARIIVAGGGGSDGATSKPGKYGGGTAGGDATESYGTIGYGGAQTGCSGGSSYVTTSQSSGTSSSNDCKCGFGFGGNGVYYSGGYAGAGGGGWYGGCGSYPDGSGDDDRGGGGGSGYIFTSSTKASYPSGCLLTDDMFLSEAQTIAGSSSFTSPSGSAETGHSGDGYCRITVIEVYSSFNIDVKVGNSWKTMDSGFVKVGGSWKSIDSIFTKINGSWKQSG